VYSTTSSNTIQSALVVRKSAGYKVKVMIFAGEDRYQMSIKQSVRPAILGYRNFLALVLSALVCGSPALAQSSQAPIRTEAVGGVPAAPGIEGSGSITGTVVDQTGAPVEGAQVVLARADLSPNQEALSGSDGQFNFSNVAPGPFQILVTLSGFTTQASAGVLRARQTYSIPQIVLVVATAVTEVRVVPSPQDVAEDQMKDQEKQRVLGFVPNFYVSYAADAAPLSSKQKFALAWKTTADPISIGVSGAAAGIEQAQNVYGGYGQGAQGFGKRFGASYADFAAGTFIGSAILPSLLKQDPRYFYKGSGSKRRRVLYAIANSVICKSDHGRWEPNYSSVLGSLAAGGISNLYYPASDRNGTELTFENAGLALGATAGVNVLQEFVIRKLTRNVPQPAPANP
jgi:hypothetical protein